MMRPKQREKMLKRKADKHTSDMRACGECDACCTVLAVSDLPGIPKPRHVPCVHLKLQSHGCNIYEERPESCRKFYCLWLIKYPGFTGEMRPDRFGIVAWPELTHVGESMCIDEVEPGAFDRPEVKSLLRELGARLPLVLFGRGDMRRLIVPGRAIEAVRHASEVFGGEDGRVHEGEG